MSGQAQPGGGPAQGPARIVETPRVSKMSERGSAAACVGRCRGSCLGRGSAPSPRGVHLAATFRHRLRLPHSRILFRSGPSGSGPQARREVRRAPASSVRGRVSRLASGDSLGVEAAGDSRHQFRERAGNRIAAGHASANAQAADGIANHVAARLAGGGAREIFLGPNNH